MSGLTKKQERFVEEYLVDLNATQAAIRAGYSPKTAEQMGYQLLQKTSVQKKLEQAMDQRSKRVEITQDRVLREYARLAFFDPRKLFDDEGNPRHVTELDDDTAAALVGLDVVKEVDPDTGDVTYTKKYKLVNKLGALDSLGKHLGLFDGKGGKGEKPENNLLDAIAESAQEDIGTDDIPEIQ